MSSFIKALRRSSLKHKRLCEDWRDNRDPVIDGVTFYVKYIGSTLVHQAKGDRATAEAIKTIVSMAKMSGKKLERVAFKVDPKSILVLEALTKRLQFQVPIYRISYCSADSYYNSVFAFIAVNVNEMLECHAFLCPKKKIAHAVTLTVAQAFNVAFDVWQNAKDQLDTKEEMEEVKSLSNAIGSEVGEKQNNGEQPVLLINFEEDAPTNEKPLKTSWNLVHNFDWDSNFEKFIQDRYFPVHLESNNLHSETMDDLHSYISSAELNERQCIFQDDAWDLATL